MIFNNTRCGGNIVSKLNKENEEEKKKKHKKKFQKRKNNKTKLDK